MSLHKYFVNSMFMHIVSKYNMAKIVSDQLWPYHGDYQWHHARIIELTSKCFVLIHGHADGI